MKNVIVFDIDGTLANCDHRLHYIKQNPPDWEKFCAPEEVLKDAVIEDVAQVARMLAADDTEIVMCTGRDAQHKDATRDWLWRNNIPCDRLLMRPEGDRRPDHVVKPELLAKAGYTPDKVLAIFEDRTSVVDEWRRLGYTCFQVAKGDF